MLITEEEKNLYSIMLQAKPDYPSNNPSAFSIDYLEKLSGMERVHLIQCLNHMYRQGYVQFPDVIKRGKTEKEPFAECVLLNYERQYPDNLRKAKIKMFLKQQCIAIIALIIAIIALIMPFYY